MLGWELLITWAMAALVIVIVFLYLAYLFWTRQPAENARCNAILQSKIAEEAAQFNGLPPDLRREMIVISCNRKLLVLGLIGLPCVIALFFIPWIGWFAAFILLMGWVRAVRLIKEQKNAALNGKTTI